MWLYTTTELVVGLLLYVLCLYVLRKCIADSFGTDHALARYQKTGNVSDSNVYVFFTGHLELYFQQPCTFSQFFEFDYEVKSGLLYHSRIQEAVFYGQSVLDHPVYTLYFWCVVLILFAIGCMLMFKFKKKFIDMI